MFQLYRRATSLRKAGCSPTLSKHLYTGQDIDVEPHPTVLFISDDPLSTGHEHSCHSLVRLLYFLVCRPREHSPSVVASSGLSRRGGSPTGSGTEYCTWIRLTWHKIGAFSGLEVGTSWFRVEHAATTPHDPTSVLL
ncbi:hypothetical protein Bbelb_087320 [Branchiostoma belcheri]|nr:hypothetical protein Bbelb_087320 [Branchiostoma belcheri]